jgi:hypothetical protein
LPDWNAEPIDKQCGFCVMVQLKFMRKEAIIHSLNQGE